MKNNSLLVFLLLGILTVSCRKDIKNSPTPLPPKATKVSELIATENFKWKTSKTMVLNVVGLNTSIPVSRTLIVSSVDMKEIYFKNLQLMSQTNVSTFVIPSKVTEVLISYGKISKKITLSGTIIQFNYTPSN